MTEKPGTPTEAGAGQTGSVGQGQAESNAGDSSSDSAATAASESDASVDAADGDTEPGSESQDEDRRKPKNFRGRWDHLNEQERRVVELATKRGLTLTEAYRAVFGNGGVAATPAGDQGHAERTADPIADLEQRIGAQEQRLGELKRQKSQAKNDLAAYDQAAEAYLEARDELRVLQDQRRSTVRQREEEAATARQRAEAVAQTALAEEFPDALTPGNELHDACAEELAYLRDSQSPLIHDPEVQYKVARRMARALGWHRADEVEVSAQEKHKPLNPMPKQTNQDRSSGTSGETAGTPCEVAAIRSGAVAPKRTVRPVPAGGSPVETPINTLERRMSEARSSHAMLSLMREFGTPFEALLKR